MLRLFQPKRKLSAEEQRAEQAKQRWLTEVEQDINRGVPRGVIYRRLMNIDTIKMDLADMLAISAATSFVEGVMVDRNLRGIELEKQGRLDEAISLYEANVADKFDGTHPYTRLRIIYTKRTDYQAAIRICQAFLSDIPPKQRADSPFQHHLAKLIERRQRARVDGGSD